MVPRKGLEPSHLTVPASKTGASTNSAIWARVLTAVHNSFSFKKAIATLSIITHFATLAAAPRTDEQCLDSLRLYLRQKALISDDIRSLGKLEAEYRTLWKKPLSDYFDRDTAHVALVDGATYQKSLMSERNVEELFRDFDRLTSLRETVDGISLKFKPWWLENRDFYIRTGWIQTILQKSEFSLADLHFEMYLQFIAQPGEIKKPGWHQRMVARLKPRAIIGSVLVGSVLLLKEFKTIAIMGTGVQAYNGYMGTVNAQIVNRAQQVGADYNAPLADWLNDRLNSMPKIVELQRALEAQVDEMTELNYDQMTFEQAHKKFEESERQLFIIYQEYQKVMPSHLRDARAHFREISLDAPIRYASAIATFELQYREAKRAVESYSSKPSLTQEELKDRDYQKQIMDAAQNSIATTVASWRIVQFLYPESTDKTIDPKNSKAALLNSNNYISRELNFNLYAQKYREQINLVLKNLKFKFLAFDAAADELAKAQNSTRAPDSIKEKKSNPTNSTPTRALKPKKVSTNVENPLTSLRPTRR